MWWARVWYLLSLLAAAALLAGALSLPGLRDPDVREAEARAAALTAELVASWMTAALDDQRSAAGQLAADPRLATTLDALPELPEEIRAAQIDSVLKKLAEGRAALGLVLVDAHGALVGSRVPDPRLPERVAGHQAVKQALAGQAPAAFVQGTFVVGAPVPGDPTPRGALLVTAPAPGTVAAQRHGARRDGMEVVVASAVGLQSGLPEDKRKALVDAAPEKEGEVGVTDALGDPHGVSRHPGPLDSTVVVAWPLDPPTGLGAVGGVAGLLERATVDPQRLGVTLGAACGLWLMGFLLASFGRRGQIELPSEPPAPATPPRPSTAPPPVVEVRRSEPPDETAEPESGPPEPESSAESSASSSDASVRSEDGARESDESLESTELSARPGQYTQPKARPPLPPPVAEPEADFRPVDREEDVVEVVEAKEEEDEAEKSPSLFDASLPSLDEDDDDPPEDHTDSDIQLPGARGVKSGGSLLQALRSHRALDPEAGPYASGESTVVRAVSLEQLAAAREDEAERTAVGPPPVAPDAQLEAYFRQVFDELVDLKTRCGEPTEALDYSRFRAKLQRTRRALMDRFDCQDVRFRVYVKDDKAALKAAPILKDS